MVIKSLWARSVLACVLVGFGVAGPMGAAVAADQEISFDIPAEPLAQALTDFSRASSQQIVFSEDVTNGHTAARLHGRYTVRQALDLLLAGTGLYVKQGPSGVLMIEAPRPKPASASGAGGKTAANEAVLEEVAVTASRIRRQGFVSPTPVTSLTSQDLRLGGYTEIGDALADTPIAKADVSPTTTSRNTVEQGFNVADLRGLGSPRTLVLVDGERPVWQTPTGFDLNTIPISLVKRVDVVTGGASAAWGSDAVSGVVNVILDNDFVGERAQLQYGSAWAGYGDHYQASAAFGSKFGPDDRGHFMVAAQWDRSALITAGQVPAENDYIIANPAHTATNGAPQELLVPNYNFSHESLGGLITTGPLKGTAFGPGGSPYAFQYGAYANSTAMAGGDLEAVGAQYFAGAAVQDADRRYSMYSRGSYEVSSGLTLKADFLYSNYHVAGPIAPLNTTLIGPFTIQSTNAYLPASTASEMAADHVTSFSLGRGSTDFGGLITSAEDLQTYWGTLGAHGDLGGTWSYDLFYSHGVSNEQGTLGPQQITTLLKESVASIVSPATGQPVCSSMALKNPVTGASCAPVDLFGEGSPSQAALDFFNAYAGRSWTLAHNEAGGEIQGEPLSSGAGPVSLAGGVEWRTEAINQTVDPLSAAGVLDFNDYHPEIGHFSVTEGFLESVVPLAKNLPAAQDVEFNGAVRESSYSTSGAITSWKVGLTDSVTDSLLLRGTLSQDIRAPNLSELYTQGAIVLTNLIDVAHGDVITPVKVFTGGNPDLQPERARTVTYGGVYHPQWLPSFDLSVDWWSIDIKNAITTESAQTEVTYCYQGDAAVCPDVIRDAAGNLIQVNAFGINLVSETSSGLDVEASQKVDLSDIGHGLGGTLESHLQMTYVDKMTGYDGISFGEGVGDLSGETNAPSQLRWRGVLAEIYHRDRLLGYARLRFVSGGIYSPTVSIDRNEVGSQYYVDVGASYYLNDGRNWQIYANVVNAFNRGTPPIPISFYDLFGRTYSVGVRLAL